LGDFDMLIRREQTGDEPRIRCVHELAFRRPEKPEEPPEAALVDDLRSSAAWIPELSLVALSGSEIVGHVVCSRSEVLPDRPVLGLAPLGVHPGVQGRGVGSALMHAVLAAADARDEPLVALLGSPAYYSRFGFLPSHQCGIEPPETSWGQHFQVRTLSAYDSAIAGQFRYAAAFDLL
jgi:putative acetyltransferase